MNYWLMKTEPATFSIEDLARAPQRTSMWDGVRNFQARNMLRDDMARNDRVLLYHSSCAVPGVVGVMRIERAGYPDPTAFERKHAHFDADSDRRNPRWYAVDVRLERALTRVIALDELRRHAERELAGMLLLRRGNRLSVMPLDALHFDFVLALE